MTYSKKIKSARERLLLTQEEFAAKLGVNSVTVCRWETGKCEPTLKAKRLFRDFCAEQGLTFED